MDPSLNGRPPEGAATALGDAGNLRVISSYSDARAILVDAAARVPGDKPPSIDSGLGPTGAVVARGVHLRGLWMWGCDTDRRALFRKAAAAALGPASIDLVGPYLETRASDLLAAGSETSEIDLVAGFARPLVRDALMELFGVGPAARPALQAQVDVMAGFNPGNGSAGTARSFALAATAGHLEDLWSKPLPPNAAASRTLRGAVQAGELSLDEALAQATLLLFGNSYTTLDALTGLMERLAGSPSHWQAARSGAIPVAALVEESLRLGPPANLILFREAVGEIDCPGGVIPAGARIVLPLDRLNRDPASFERADRFDPDRSGPPHLAFGAGRHMCVGLHLARAVLRTAVEALLRRLPEWAAEMRVDRAPGVLGGPSVVRLVVPSGAFRPC